MIAVVAGMIVRDGRVLIARRPEKTHMGGRWEFPGGKIQSGECPEEALARELKEELDAVVAVGRVYHAVTHSYPEKDVLLLFYPCRIISGEPRAVEEAEIAWICREQLNDFDWPEADRATAQRLAREGFETLI